MKITTLSINMVLLSTIPSAAIANECRGYLECDSQIGWYFSLEAGNASTDITSSDMQTFYENSELSVSDISDDNDFYKSILIGYQVTHYFAVEAGYMDLGDRSVSFTGETTDFKRFYDNAEHIFPQSGDGWTANVLLSYPINNKVKVSAKLGVFDWEGDFHTNEVSSVNMPIVGSDKINGTDFWYGGEISYHLSAGFQLYFSAAQVELERDTNDVFALGVRYYLKNLNLAK